METIKLIILAIIQGITEPLPISSSGHLVIFEEIMNLNLPGFQFELFVNFGSLLGIIVYFRKDLMAYLKTLNKVETRVYSYKVLLATIPAGFIGFYYIDSFELFKSANYVAGFLIVTGILLLVGPRIIKERRELSYNDSLYVGLAQAAALIPGISRSGITTVAGISRGLSREDAFKFSFMIYIPISFASGIYSLFKLDDFGVEYLLYFTIAAVMTYIGLIFFKKILLQDRLHYFAIYCFLLASLIIITII